MDEEGLAKPPQAVEKSLAGVTARIAELDCLIARVRATPHRLSTPLKITPRPTSPIDAAEPPPTKALQDRIGSQAALFGSHAAAAYQLARRRLPSCIFVATATAVPFNLAAILLAKRQISALWSRTDHDIERSLAISGSLRAYGAVPLAAGFFRRDSFLHWQTLIPSILVIANFFLYAASAHSQAYRVANLSGLGALLMPLSFAYQKHWPGLQQLNSGGFR